MSAPKKQRKSHGPNLRIEHRPGESSRGKRRPWCIIDRATGLIIRRAETEVRAQLKRRRMLRDLSRKEGQDGDTL